MKWKKTAALAVAFIISITMLAGCAGADGDSAGISGEEPGRLKIVCTIFPEYDWAAEILGKQMENVDLTLLLKNGADLHSYQPTVADMVKISDADLFVYVGGASDFWVDEVLSGRKNEDQIALNLMDILSDQIREEEQVEGMQEERGHEEEDETEYDEHVWLSLRNAKAVCEALTEALCELDETNQSEYMENMEAYTAQLDALDASYQEVADQAACPVLLFGDRFPFRYLAEDYGLSYYAAFSGCSAETEASFGTITFLAGKVDELELPVVFSIDGSDQKIARVIADNTISKTAEVRVLDSMQSVSAADIEAGENYLSIMERNLEALKAALPGTWR
jgi:zinc transport system substrate-binding protein